MYYVGIDIGSTASKVVVLGDKELKFVLPTGWSSKDAAQSIKETLLKEGIDVVVINTVITSTSAFQELLQSALCSLLRFFLVLGFAIALLHEIF